MYKGCHCESLVECVWVSILVVVGSGLEVSIPLSAELICQTLFEPMFPPPLTTGSFRECTPAVPFRPLRNQGNECFINASMQALLVVPAMRHQCARIHSEFTSQNINLRMRRERSSAQRDCDSLVAEAWKLCSEDLVYDSPVHLSALSKLFYSGNQEDAHEFLMNLLNANIPNQTSEPLISWWSEFLQCGN